MDVLVRQADAAVVGRQRRVIPFRDLAQEDAGNAVPPELELAVRNTVQVVGHRDGAKRAGDLHDFIGAAHRRGLLGRQRDVAGTVVDRLFRQLRDAGTGAAAAVVDRDLAELLVVGKVGGVVERLRERRAGAGQLRRRRHNCTTGRGVGRNGVAAARGKQDRSAQ